MKKSILILGAITLFLVGIITIAETKENQKTKWKGKVETESGVKVIKNPIEPLYGEIELELEEDLSIGNEMDENYMFIRVSDIEVDEKARSYDLFSQEGYYLYRVKMDDFFPQIIKNGFIYTSKSDPDTGYYKVKRYRIKNWNKIKEGL